MKVLLALAMVLQTCKVEAKNTYCRNKYKEDDFIYCTKFGVEEQGTALITYRAKFLATYKKTEDLVGMKIGIYSDSMWE